MQVGGASGLALLLCHFVPAELQYVRPIVKQPLSF